MKTHIQVKPLVLVCLGLVLLTGCAAAETATPEPIFTPSQPAATLEQISCENVDGNCIDVWFDGEACSNTGPELVQAGPITFIFHNQSDGEAGIIVGKLEKGKTMYDVLENLGPPGSERTEYLPYLIEWMETRAGSGESGAIKRVAPAGTYYWVCGKSVYPIPVWGGATLIVED